MRPSAGSCRRTSSRRTTAWRSNSTAKVLSLLGGRILGTCAFFAILHGAECIVQIYEYPSEFNGLPSLTHASPRESAIYDDLKAFDKAFKKSRQACQRSARGC